LRSSRFINPSAIFSSDFPNYPYAKPRIVLYEMRDLSELIVAEGVFVFSRLASEKLRGLSSGWSSHTPKGRASYDAGPGAQIVRKSTP
jgi:hypothetical protein